MGLIPKTRQLSTAISYIPIFLASDAENNPVSQRITWEEHNGDICDLCTDGLPWIWYTLCHRNLSVNEQFYLYPR